MFLCIHKTDYAYRKVTKYQKYIFFCIKQTLKNWPQMTPGSQTPTYWIDFVKNAFISSYEVINALQLPVLAQLAFFCKQIL